MTRINCIPVEELTDKHLIAEYRELPRVFKLARPDADIPPTYRMGKGHVTFFYDKLHYLFMRQWDIYDELLRREFNPKYSPAGLMRFGPKECWNSWEPTPEAMEINRARIAERLAL